MSPVTYVNEHRLASHGFDISQPVLTYLNSSGSQTTGGRGNGGRRGRGGVSEEIRATLPHVKLDLFSSHIDSYSGFDRQRDQASLLLCVCGWVGGGGGRGL